MLGRMHELFFFQSYEGSLWSMQPRIIKKMTSDSINGIEPRKGGTKVKKTQFVQNK